MEAPASRFNTNTSTNCIWVNLVKDKIRILGTYISYSKQLANQYNFVNVTTDTKNILSIWRLRGLSLAGRIQIFKASVLSKAVFICTMKRCSEKFVDDLNVIKKILFGEVVSQNNLCKCPKTESKPQNSSTRANLTTVRNLV